MKNPFSSDESVCKGKFGMVENSNGEKVKGIEMSCPDHEDDRVVVEGDKDTATQRANQFLEDKGWSAKIRDDS